jgi:hypothetical protein
MEQTYTFSGVLPPIDFGDEYIWIMPIMDEPRVVLYDASRFIPWNDIPCNVPCDVPCNDSLTSRIKYDPNRCTECKKVFARAWIKREHMKCDHPETYPYKCDMCGGRYSSKGGLSGHRYKVHGTVKGVRKLCVKKLHAL